MARTFPTIVDFSSALRFALEAEMAGADLTAAAEVIAPDETCREKLEELTCAHDDRLQKLRARGDAMGAAAAGQWRAFDGAPFARVLGVDPETSWPAAAAQVAVIEDGIADYHDAFVVHAGDGLGDAATLFVKASEQARAAAALVRHMLG